MITSRAHPLVKHIRALRHRKAREEQGEFFVEGIRAVWMALEKNAGVQTIVLAPELLKSAPARELVEAQSRAGVRVLPVSRSVFENLAEREHPSGLGAIVKSTWRGLKDLRAAPNSFFVALQAVGNPGNLGTILRTVDATGGGGVILIGNTTDPYHPTAVKASMGTLFTVPIARAEDLQGLVEWAKMQNIQCVTTSSTAPTLYWEAEYRLPSLFLFGSEGEGLDEEIFQQGDLSVQIPMAGSADSLNLAVSVGVLLYEVKRQQWIHHQHSSAPKGAATQI